MHKLLSSALILISTLFPVMAFGQAVDLDKAVGELTDVFRHTLSQSVNVHCIKDMTRSFRIDDLGNKSGLVGSTAILIDRGQPFNPPQGTVIGSGLPALNKLPFFFIL